MSVILTLDPNVTISQVLPGLRKARFKVSTVLENLHIVAGQGDEASLKKVRSLPYVVSVEHDRTVHLDPRETPDMGPDWPAKAETRVSPKVTGASWRSPAWDDTEKG